MPKYVVSYLIVSKLPVVVVLSEYTPDLFDDEISLVVLLRFDLKWGAYLHPVLS